MYRSLKISLLPCAALLFAGFASSCSNPEGSSADAKQEVVVSVGDSVLTSDRVMQMIPEGLSPQDSVAMYNAIVEDWLRERLLCDIATDNLPHPEIIEKRVREYRNRLIAIEYRKLMGANAEPKASDDSIKAFYEHHRNEMKLQAPIIKGLYIKIPANDRKIDDIRGWIKLANPQSIDKLEKHGLQNAMQYDHFADRWIDWNTVAEQIPYRFGNADEFLSKGKVFETEYDGNLYLLHVTDVLHTGAEMPYDYAAGHIRNMMADNERAAYDARLLRSLYDKGVREKRITDNRKKK